MSDFTMVDPRGWEYDLHSVRHKPIVYSQKVLMVKEQVYSAYIGFFQLHNIPWYVPEFDCTFVERTERFSGGIDLGGTCSRRLKNFSPFHGQSSPSPIPGQEEPILLLV